MFLLLKNFFELSLMLEDCPRNYCVAEAELEPLAFVLYSPRSGNSGACYFTWILKRCFIMGKASTTAALVKRQCFQPLKAHTPSKDKVTLPFFRDCSVFYFLCTLTPNQTCLNKTVLLCLFSILEYK